MKHCLLIEFKATIEKSFLHFFALITAPGGELGNAHLITENCSSIDILYVEQLAWKLIASYIMDT
jgi:hypothetical protein